jgi:hypothetical protein
MGYESWKKLVAVLQVWYCVSFPWNFDTCGIW